MNLVNKVFIQGHIGGDAVVQQAGENFVANFRVAHTKRWKDAQGKTKEVTGWYDVEAWNGLSKIAEEFAKKGRKVLIEGRLKHNPWEDKDGKKHSRTIIVAESLDVALPPKQQ